MRYYKAEKIENTRDLLKRAVKKWPDRVAFKEFDSDRQQKEYTFTQLDNDREALGSTFLEMGMKGYHVALIGESLYAWVLSYLTVINGVGVIIPMDKELKTENMARLLKQGDTNAIICSDTYVPLVQEIRELCPEIDVFITMNSTETPEGFYKLDNLIEQGKQLIAQGNKNYIDQSIDNSVMCELLFTSGTTGANKGVMLCQKNLMTDIYGMMQIVKTYQTSISVLPINHSFECTCHILGGIYCGMTVCFNDDLRHLMENLTIYKPQMSLMVPLFLETMYKRIWIQAAKENLDDHLRYGIRYSNFLRKIGLDLRRLFFKPVLEKFGGELRLIISGGAPLRSELIKGFDELGIKVVNGYGITECSPVVSVNSTRKSVYGSVGHVIPVCDVRIVNSDSNGVGEVEVKGDIVMLGYYKDEESTKKVFSVDGYFNTGDLGSLDSKNNLFLHGRKKNLIILPNGENVCPEELEELILDQIPYIKEVVVFSYSKDDSPDEYITAEIFIDPNYEFEKNTDIEEKVMDDIRKVNNLLPGYKRIAGVEIREIEFEKTTTKKIKRQQNAKGRKNSERRVHLA